MCYVKLHSFELSLDKQGRLSRAFVKCGDIQNCVYFIVIDGTILYIGKARDLWKRMDTYRNSKYWKIANPSNVLKTGRLELAIRKKKKVELVVHECETHTFDSYEIEMIKHHSPMWNEKHCKRD